MLKGSVVEAPNQSSDVYSFGLIMWESLSGERPFKDLTLPELKVVVIEQRQRPKIPEDWNLKWSGLIRRCWDQDPEMRPTFLELQESLSSGVTTN